MGHSISYLARESGIARNFMDTLFKGGTGDTALDILPHTQVDYDSAVRTARLMSKALKAANEDVPDPGPLDVETRAVAKEMDQVEEMAAQKLYNDDTHNVWDDVDPDDFAGMSQEERDALVSEILGEELFEDQNILWETGQLDADGQPMYESKNAGDLASEIEENMRAMDEFIGCMSGVAPDG
jgi:hypothetical protein